MAKRIVFSLLAVIISCVAMDQDSNNDAQNKIVSAIIDSVKPSYEQAFRIVDSMEAGHLGEDLVDVLKKVATQKEYQPLLAYIFEKDKIRPADDLASNMLIEAAAADDSTSNLQALLSHNVNPNKPGQRLVHANRDTNLYTPLLIAIIEERCTNVKILLKAGADANSCQPHENLPLVESFKRYHILKRQGGQPRFNNPRCTRYFIHMEIMHLLREKGADEHKDNGKDVEIEDNHQITRCRTVWDMKCCLGYTGI